MFFLTDIGMHAAKEIYNWLAARRTGYHNFYIGQGMAIVAYFRDET
jgi:hypothetical protein